MKQIHIDLEYQLQELHGTTKVTLESIHKEADKRVKSVLREQVCN